MVALSFRFVVLLLMLLVSVVLVRTMPRKKSALQNPQFCRIMHHANVLMAPMEDDATEGGGQLVPTSITECHAPHTGGVPTVHEMVDHTGVNVWGPQHVGLYLAYEAHWVDPTTHHIALPPSYRDDLELIYLPQDPLVRDHWTRHGLVPPDAPHRRSLQSNVSSLLVNGGKMIIARVRTADEDVVTTAAAIAAFVFTAENTSFSLLHEACTIGNKVVVPWDPATPVYEIALSGNSSQYTFGSFFTAAEPLLISQLALSVASLAEVAEYVLLISPAGLRPTIQQPNFRFVAAGAYDSYRVVVTDDWIDTPQVLQHEIGCVSLWHRDYFFTVPPTFSY
jgi:hypothetical protein